MNVMQEEWKKYRDMVYPKGMTAEQNKQLHGAFFAGALSYMMSQRVATNEPEEAAFKRLAALEREVFEVNAQRAMLAGKRN